MKRQLDRGVAAVVAITILVVGFAFVGTCWRKVDFGENPVNRVSGPQTHIEENQYIPRIVQGERSPPPPTPDIPLEKAVAPAGQPSPTFPPDGPGGLRFSPGVRRALDMLRRHESVNGTQMVGDGGKAQGWLQQHRDHWQVGCEVLGVSWPWPADTRDLAKCEMVAVANWWRYARAYMEAGNVEELVRRFRLPSAPYREDNDAYWANLRWVMGPE